MKFRALLTLLLVLVAVSASPSSFPQALAFDAEVDCNGVFIPGDSVPFFGQFENNTLDAIPLDVVIALDAPGVGMITLVDASFTLGPNQDRVFSRSMSLPGGAPNGAYSMRITAMSATEIASDTCSFHVQ